MNILWAMDFDTHDLYGGGDVFSTQILSNGLKDRGHTVELYNPTWPGGGILPWFTQRVITATRFAKRIRSVLKDNPPSVVIAQNHVFPYVVREALRLDIPVVVVCRDIGYRCPQSTKSNGCSGSCGRCIGKMALFPYPWFRHHINLKRKYLPLANGWVVPSEYIAQDMRDWFPTTRPVVIYPPMDNSHIPKPNGERSAILFMGGGEYKGADIALKLAQYFEWEYDFKVCGTQDPDHRCKFKQLINVELCGFVPRPVAFRGSRILIAPARWAEPFGRIVGEAGWLGIPSIVSDRGGLGESVGPGGLMIDRPDDMESWIDAIKLLMENDGAYRDYSLLARGWSKRFEATAQVGRFEKMLTEVIDNGR